MEQIIQNSLLRWIHRTSNPSHCLLTSSTENLSRLIIGPSVDSKVNLTESEPITVRLSNKREIATSDDTQNVVACDSHLVDVPADANCSFHTIGRGCFPYGRKTFLGTDMPSTSQECRIALVDFIKSHLREIEDYGSNATHSQICASIFNDGIMGHWLGAGIGGEEIHILGRALGVTVYCVMAASDEDGIYCLRKTIGPYPCLCTGLLRGSPKGAVVIRFMGGYDSGHYRIVKCGRSTERILDSPALKSRKGRNKRRLRQVNENEFTQDLAAVDHMHGVQPQTKKRYVTDYGLVDSTFLSLMVRDIDPTDLEKIGLQVVRAIMAVLLPRCGPWEKGYENLSAKAIGKIILAAVGTWYQDRGKSFNETHTTVVSGQSVRGPPWKAQQVLEVKQTLLKMQAKSRTVLERKAYQLTHDDVTACLRYSVAKQLGTALDAAYLPGSNPNVNWLQLQTSLMVVAAFGSGCRGAEMTTILLGDLNFLYEGADTTIGVTLYGVRSKTGNRAVRRIVFPAWSGTSVISPAFAVLTQIALIHRVTSASDAENAESPFFPSIHRN